jgi:hypothetical protein
MKVVIILIFILLSGGVRVMAQASINAAGGDGASQAGSASHAVGQAFYTLDTGSGSALKGVQLPLVVQVVGIVSPELSSKIVVFPNPVASTVILTVDKDIWNPEMEFYLYDIDHGLINDGKVVRTTIEVSMEGFASGAYIMIIKDRGIVVNTFKILKVD